MVHKHPKVTRIGDEAFYGCADDQAQPQAALTWNPPSLPPFLCTDSRRSNGRWHGYIRPSRVERSSPAPYRDVEQHPQRKEEAEVCK